MARQPSGSKEIVVMSTPAHQQPDDRQIELGTAINWPAISTAISLGAVLMIAPVGLLLLFGSGTAPRQQARAQRGPLMLEPLAPLPTLPGPRSLNGQPVPPSSTVVVVRTEPGPETLELLPLPAIVARKPTTPPAAPPPVSVAVSSPPAPAAPAEVAKEVQGPTFKRPQQYSEVQLIELLGWYAREVNVEAEKGASAKLLEEGRKLGSQREGEKRDQASKAPLAVARMQPLLDLIARRDDLKGLPLRDGPSCQVDRKEAEAMQSLPRELHLAIARQDESDASEVRLKDKAWRDDVGIRMLVQLLQAEDFHTRRQLIRLLAEKKGKSASVALAQRAVFDLCPENRQAAVTMLRDRPVEEYRSVLLEALRYPWPPVADHAAEALVALDDWESAVDLVDLLDLPDPQIPTQQNNKKWVVAELVRVNHLSNCALCHPASSPEERDCVLGAVPERGKRLPAPFGYYTKGFSHLVRADVTYLKQDFSVMQATPDHGVWPIMQRYDFLVRKRELSAEEAARLAQDSSGPNRKPNSYPQREAVLWALRELTR
jgi:hypothetical protein